MGRRPREKPLGVMLVTPAPPLMPFALHGGLDGAFAFEVGPATIVIRSTAAADIPLILQFIRDLAAYEQWRPEVEATEERLRATLFPPQGRPAAECLLAFWRDQPTRTAAPGFSVRLNLPGARRRAYAAPAILPGIFAPTVR